MLNGLDLFSGVGGLTAALEPWVRPVAYCEIERYAQGILLSRMAEGRLPFRPIWDDITTLGHTQIEELPTIDIIYGGFPCQDISVAGNGAGLAGERSGLVFQVLRLIGEVQPTFVFLENVPAIRTRGAERVVKELAKLGYDCRWGCLSAHVVDAPHKRERWFCLARRRLPDPRREHDQSHLGCMEKASRPTREQERRNGPERMGSTVPPPGGISIGRDCQWYATEPNMGRVANGVPNRVDRLRALGNAVIPSQAREAFCRLMGLSLAQSVDTTSEPKLAQASLGGSAFYWAICGKQE